MSLPNGPYNSNQSEPEMLSYWLEHKYFKPEYYPGRGLLSMEEMKNDDRTPFSIVNPPPNAYMRPHIGNVSGYAYQDVFLRFNRMLGKKVLGQPGKDHAGIQGEVTVEKIFIQNKGKDKQMMGREKFYKAAYEHFTKLMPMIMADEQRIGLSSDYDRNLFTLDPKVVDIVLGTFSKMYTDKMVYKGVRIVNWDPVAKTTLADIDTERVERETDLVYIKYPLVGEDGSITVATTRPETMLGDTAVVVHPEDPRYQGLIGKKVHLPLTDREIPIITSHRIEREFGTGGLKLTPAHAYDDYVIMNEWNAENPDKQVGYVNVIDKEAKLSGPVADKYKGLTTEAARQIVIADLKEQGLIEKIEKHLQNVVIGERSKAVVEPIMSSQWFIDVEKLKQPAIEKVKNGEVKIHPSYMAKKYLNWMENLHDWPVSRSLWWGYRIPVWYKGELEERIDEQGQVVELIAGTQVSDIYDAVAKGLALVQVESPGEGWIQDPDVFDTWFSSGQWVYATLFANELGDTFMPTDIMETAYDILELWVSRMMMLTLYTQGEIPFKHVYLHGLVKAPDGQKMGKSKGNVVQPTEVIDKYGADSLRLLYLVGNKAGAGYPVSYEKLEGYKRFLNKIWNASKFVLSITADMTGGDTPSSNEQDIKLLQGLDELTKSVTKHIEHFRLGMAAELLYQEFWHTFCDVYLEEVKPRIYTKDREGNAINTSPEAQADRASAQITLLTALRTYMQLLHPFIPFITERVWQELPKSEEESKTVMHSKWPRAVIVA